MIEILVPLEIPEDEEVLVLEVTVESGQKVMASQIIFVLETSKTTYEIVAEQTGIVYHSQSEGSECKAGDILGRIDVP